MVTTYLKIVGKIKGQRNTRTKLIRTHLKGLLAKMKLQFGTAFNFAAHNILKENYGI